RPAAGRGAELITRSSGVSSLVFVRTPCTGAFDEQRHACAGYDTYPFARLDARVRRIMRVSASTPSLAADANGTDRIESIEHDAFLALPRISGRRASLVVRAPEERIQRDVLRHPDGKPDPNEMFRPCKDLRGEPEAAEHEQPADELQREILDDDVLRPHTVMKKSSSDRRD